MTDLRENIASIISDYRHGEIQQPNAAHVDRWIRQFPSQVRDPILAELAHVLSKSYVTKISMQNFIRNVVNSDRLTRSDPKSYWRDVEFLRLQKFGNSQRDMLSIFDVTLKEVCGFTTNQREGNPKAFIYLDDGVFSGGRVKADLVKWVAESAPKMATLEVIVISLHLYGQFVANKAIQAAAQEAGKTINIRWWRLQEIEDRKAYTDNSDVLRPISIPAEAAAYVGKFQYPVNLRGHSKVGDCGFFSSGAGRHLLEQEFFKGGIEVRNRCPNLPEQMRPLGSTWLQTPGFGTMFVTYRNIANNTPLVLWAGNPWYPLFPRKTN